MGASGADPADQSKQSLQSAFSADSGQARQNLQGASTLGTATKPQKTQLVKTATLTLRVKAIEPSLKRTAQIVSSQEGDILSLQDDVPQNETAYHTASLRFRVPQARLDAVLTDLVTLGTVESRAIQAEDVASQIVDFDARLKNLRRAEETVLGIMSRSGSVGDVLKVSQELTNIRSEIEQIQAQVQSLRQRVAYSTVDLSIKEAITQTQPGIPLGERLKESWSESTHAIGNTTAGLLQLAVWLLVFSPYLVGIAAAVLLIRKAQKRRRPAADPLASDSSSN